VVSQRNRAEGWQYAKHSGHQRELDLAAELQSDSELSSWIHSEAFGTPETSTPRVKTSGMAMDRVASVLGGLTVPKFDLEVDWPGRGAALKVSVKKSDAGQVWLVTPDRFVKGFEAQFQEAVPAEVVEGLRLFIGPLELAEMEAILGGRVLFGGNARSSAEPQEFHQRRFVARSLAAYRPDTWRAMLDWFRTEMPRIAELCFARGLVAHPDDYASAVLYSINERASGTVGHFFFSITELVNRIQLVPHHRRAEAGPQSGGSTLILPFGFLQMHNPKRRGQVAWNNQLQFHHRRRDLLRLFSDQR